MEILQGIHPIFPLGFSLKHAPFCGMLKIFIGLFMCQFFTAYYLPVEKSVQHFIPVCGPEFWYSQFGVCCRT